MTCKASEDKPKVPRGWRLQESRPQTRLQITPPGPARSVQKSWGATPKRLLRRAPTPGTGSRWTQDSPGIRIPGLWPLSPCGKACPSL